MNHLQIVKVFFVVGLNVKLVPLLRKLKLQSKDKSEILDIRKEILNCSTDFLVCFIQWKSCFEQYVGSAITPLRSSLINYKSGARKVSKVYERKCNVFQEQFRRHFNSEGHNGMEEWKITIIDRAKNAIELRRRGSCWQHRLDTFIPNRLNERFVGIPMLQFVLRFSS